MSEESRRVLELDTSYEVLPDTGDLEELLALAPQLARQVEALEVEREWRDIESAPKDGTFIWLTDGSQLRIGFWVSGKKHEARGTVGGGWLDFCTAEQTAGACGLRFAPTKWMSVPEPPK